MLLSTQIFFFGFFYSWKQSPIIAIHVSVCFIPYNTLDVDPHLVRWIAALLTNRNQRVRVGEALSPPIWLNGGTPQRTKLAPLLFCILVNSMASNCTNTVKYVDDAKVMEFVPSLSPS